MEKYAEMKSDKDLVYEPMYITPDMAQRFLKHNSSNRKISMPLVQQLAKDMTDGNWITTHLGIAFDSTGNLSDGQHRMTAIILSKKTVKINVARYPYQISTMLVPFDTGKNRTVYDFTGIKANELAMYHAITCHFPSFGKKQEPVKILYMQSICTAEVQKLEKLTGLLICAAPNTKAKENLLQRHWAGWFKATCLAAIIADVDIMPVLKDFRKEKSLMPCVIEFKAWSDSQRVKAGGNFMLSAMIMLWNVLVRKVFSHYDSGRDDLNDLARSDLRRIYQFKYPQAVIVK